MGWHISGNINQNTEHFIQQNILKFYLENVSHLFYPRCVNSLWLSDIIWWQGSRSILGQVMAFCLTAPSHYLNQCWLMISKVLWRSPDSNFTENTHDIYRWNEFEIYYRQVSNIRCILVGNEIVDHSDVVGASPVGAARTTSSFSTQHLASLDWAKTTARRDEKHLSLGFSASYIRDFTVIWDCNQIPQGPMS